MPPRLRGLGPAAAVETGTCATGAPASGVGRQGCPCRWRAWDGRSCKVTLRHRRPGHGCPETNPPPEGGGLLRDGVRGRAWVLRPVAPRSAPQRPRSRDSQPRESDIGALPSAGGSTSIGRETPKPVVLRDQSVGCGA